MVAPATTEVELPTGVFSGDTEGLTTNHWLSGSSIKKS